jgi:hypothetical protein
MILEERKRRTSSTNGGDIGRMLHPSPTAGTGKPERSSLELNVYRCRQCGFRCDSERVQSPGFTSTGNGGVTVVNGDPQVASGSCHFCGSQNSRA